MKANVIFAAIAMSMISAVAFGQEAAPDAAVNAIRGAVEAGRTAGTVGSDAAAAAGALSGAGSLLNANERATADSMLPASRVDQQTSEVGASCMANSPASRFVGADRATFNMANALGLIHDSCLTKSGDTDDATAQKVIRILGAETQVLGNTKYSDASADIKLAVGKARIQAIAAAVGVSEDEAATIAVKLCKHTRADGNSQICYGTAATCAGSDIPAAVQYGVNPATVSL